MKKILSIVEISLLALAALSVILWMVGAVDVDMMLWVAYIYLVLSIGAVIVMMAMNAGKSRNNSKLGLFVYGGVVVAAILLYFVAGSSAPVTGADGTVFDNAFTLKSTDMMLYLAYLSLIAVVGILLWGEIRKAIK